MILQSFYSPGQERFDRYETRRNIANSNDEFVVPVGHSKHPKPDSAPCSRYATVGPSSLVLIGSGSSGWGTVVVRSEPISRATDRSVEYYFRVVVKLAVLGCPCLKKSPLHDVLIHYPDRAPLHVLLRLYRGHDSHRPHVR